MDFQPHQGYLKIWNFVRLLDRCTYTQHHGWDSVNDSNSSLNSSEGSGAHDGSRESRDLSSATLRLVSTLTERVTELESRELETAISLTSTINKLRRRVQELEGNRRGAQGVSCLNVPEIHHEVVRYLQSS